MQHAQTNEVDAEEASEAELEGGVDDEARRTGYYLDDGIPRCDEDRQCGRPLGDIDPLRAVARSRNQVLQSGIGGGAAKGDRVTSRAVEC